MGIWFVFVWIAASIEGRLWNPVTGAPVRKADVVVGTTGGIPVKRAISDVNGHYVVDGLSAGRYRVAAGRAGYLPALASTVVTLKANETRRDVNLAMDLPAMISGHVLDAEGDPVERVRVTALRMTATKLTASGAGETNDRGEYRVAGLTAGRYLLHTSQLEEYAPVFYPDAVEFEGAASINVARGSEARDIDLHVSRAPVGEIAGVVNGPAGKLVTVMVAQRSTDAVMLALPESTKEVVTGGRFSFPGLSPGTHVVTAWAEQPLSWASKEVAVNGGPVETEITMIPAREMRGEVNAPVSVVLRRANGFQSEARSVEGKLRFGGITPGTWEVAVTPAAPDSYVDSVRWGNRELLGKPIEIGSGDLPKLQIRIGSKGGTFEGAGGSVSLIPESGGPVLDAFGGDDGRYRIRGIRPGKYRLACTDESIEIAAGAVVKRDCPN